MGICGNIKGHQPSSLEPLDGEKNLRIPNDAEVDLEFVIQKHSGKGSGKDCVHDPNKDTEKGWVFFLFLLTVYLTCTSFTRVLRRHG